MKKFLMIAAMVLMSAGAFAQEKGMKCIGVGAAYGLDSDYKAFALNAKAQYNVTNYFRAEIDFKLYPKQDECRIINPNLNLQYMFPAGGEKFFIYPTVGVGILAAHYSGLDTESMFCFQGGAGAEYHISDKIKVFAEIVYQHGKKDEVKFNWPIFALGAAYYF